jgi:hypothetical protein
VTTQRHCARSKPFLAAGAAGADASSRISVAAQNPGKQVSENGRKLAITPVTLLIQRRSRDAAFRLVSPANRPLDQTFAPP